MPAIETYYSRAKAIDSLVCVGLDPDAGKIPERFQTLEFPQFEFSKWVIDETHEYAAAYKPNPAFFEARGAAGIVELKMVFDYLRQLHPDIYTILDAKRADIGNTNQGYVEFAFDWLGADAITLHPYLGREALEPFLVRADKDSIILCRTSNPGSGEFQNMESDGRPLWLSVAEHVAGKWNAQGNCLLVVGATYPAEMRAIREAVVDMPFLVPGIGAQGGDIAATVAAGKNSKGEGLLINSSRGIIFAESPREAARALRDQIRACF